MSTYHIDQIHPWLYRISEPLSLSNVCFYLIVGDERALLFDTGHGIGDIPDTIRMITTKPVDVVLGHGHQDHIGGAYQFDECYLHENDTELYTMSTSPMFRKLIIQHLMETLKELPEGFDPEAFCAAGPGNIKKLDVDRVFDLGGLSIKIIEMPGHTTGSIGLLIVEKHTLLVSDSALYHVWMFLEESTSVPQYIEMLERVSSLDFDTFFTAHTNGAHPKSDFQKFIKVAREASLEKAVPYPQLPELEPYIYESDGAAIVFSAATLK